MIKIRIISRYPAACASSSVQNQRLPLSTFIFVLSYQGDPRISYILPLLLILPLIWHWADLL